MVEAASWLPIVFGYILAGTILLYMILDGYDLGVGLLTIFTKENQDVSAMLASIGPYWDANETWLVLAIGLLLIAFPMAQGIILTKLYLPVFILLIGIIMRGIAYEMRNNCQERYIWLWNRMFFAGSLTMGITEGFIIGIFCQELQYNTITITTSIFLGLITAGLYAYNGAAWLILKSNNTIITLITPQIKICLRLTMMMTIGMVGILWYYYGITPDFNWYIIIGIWLYLFQEIYLATYYQQHRMLYLPFISVALMFTNYIICIVNYCYPYIIPKQMTVWQASASLSSLKIIFIATCILVPIIIIYNIILHYVFWGKLDSLYHD